MAAPPQDTVSALSSAAQFDICTSCDPARPEAFDAAITRLHLSGGGVLSVLKILLTDACCYDCFYCANRAGASRRRRRLRPDELASAFVDLHGRGLVNGLFLSSGVSGSPVETMAEMIASVEILRETHGFQGYVHLKILPGAPHDCIERAVDLADRVSINMEAPTQKALDRLSTSKHLAEGVIQRMHWVRQAAMRAGEGRLRSGQTTQFVVGAADESDREVLTAAEGLRRSVGLRRAYFSAFRPIAGTPLESEPATPPLRQHRLYQADWLLRLYGIRLSEIVFDHRGHLPLGVDPKLALALRNLHCFPVEVNRAAREELLRVPGIGLRSVRRVIAARRQGRITSVADLRGLGVAANRAAPFLLIDGRRAGRIGEILRAEGAAAEQLQLLFSSPTPDIGRVVAAL